MAQDFTSRTYPMISGIIDDDEEAHMEPGSEEIKSSVAEFEHPLFGLNQSVKLINSLRSTSNSVEKSLSGEVKQEVMNDMIQAAYSKKFPIDSLLIAADLKEDLTKRSGMGDANEIIDKLTEYANGMKSDTKDPKNFEVFMAFAVDGIDKAKQLLEKAASDPNKKATPIGSEYDDIIFYKLKFGERVLRTNKQVVQFFNQRMLNGSDFFPHLPLGRNTNG